MEINIIIMKFIIVITIITKKSWLHTWTYVQLLAQSRLITDKSCCLYF